MVQVYSMLWVSALFFGFIGVMRGWTREVIALGGIIVAMFALYQFDALLRGLILASVPRDQAFFVQILIFGGLVFYAYRTRSFARDDRPGRNRVQDAILGGLLGFVNGYLIWGSVWYFMDINDYPLSGLVTAPAPDSISAQNLNAIPLVLAGGITGGNETLLIIVFLVILFVIFAM